jgi:hypothetical protein
MTTRHAQPQQAGSRLATTGVVVAVAALVFSFFAQGPAVFLALVALGIAIAVLVRVRGGHPGKVPAIWTIVLAILALIIASATGSSAQQPAPVAAPAVDPDVLPAAVTIATVQSPDNLITADGRRLHVTSMQGSQSASGPCQTGTNASTATNLVQGKQVQIAAPDAQHVDASAAVPAGFQSVALTLPDGRDYAQTWTNTAAEAFVSTCLTTAPTTTTTEPPPTTTTSATPDVDVDVDRPYVPDVPSAPRTKAHSGHSGHPCLAGERDGDGDGYCGE